MERLARLSLLMVLAAACATKDTVAEVGEPDDGCSDLDRDGHGVGPECLGDDCNDLVPSVQAAEECEALCLHTPRSPGCPCTDPEPTACYVGPTGTIDVGVCTGGNMACRDGYWSACAGQVLPLDESCDRLDNDCDGETDEGVTSECGACGECGETCVGPDDGCEEWGPAGRRLIESPEGWLALDPDYEEIIPHVIWPSSSGRGDIFRVSTVTLEIEGAFWTGPVHGDGNVSNFYDGDSPSRAATDDHGDVVIANRGVSLTETTGVAGDAYDASITKIAADSASCPDRNGNGQVDTSRRWDDKLPFEGHDSWDDECILWHTNLGPVGTRAVAIEREPARGLDDVEVWNGWAGHLGKMVQFDMETGALTGREAVLPCAPYAAAVDREGSIWITGCGNGGQAVRFHPDDPEDFDLVSAPQGACPDCAALIRVTVDENDAPWFAGLDSLAMGEAWRYDRQTGQVVAVGLGGVWPEAIGNIASDGEGSIWVAASYLGGPGNFVFRIDNDEDRRFHSIETPGVTPFGIAADWDGHVWAFDYGQEDNGTATVIDVETEETRTVLDDCDGAGCLSAAYIRGDITGRQRRNPAHPSGLWTHVFEGCEGNDGTDWLHLIVDASTPPPTTVAISARTAPTLEELQDAHWTRLGSVPADRPELSLTDLERERFLEVKVTLESPGDGRLSPSLQRLDVDWSCPNALE